MRLKCSSIRKKYFKSEIIKIIFCGAKKMIVVVKYSGRKRRSIGVSDQKFYFKMDIETEDECEAGELVFNHSWPFERTPRSSRCPANPPDCSLAALSPRRSISHRESSANVEAQLTKWNRWHPCRSDASLQWNRRQYHRSVVSKLPERLSRFTTMILETCVGLSHLINWQEDFERYSVVRLQLMCELLDIWFRWILPQSSEAFSDLLLLDLSIASIIEKIESFLELCNGKYFKLMIKWIQLKSFSHLQLTQMNVFSVVHTCET